LIGNYCRQGRRRGAGLDPCGVVGRAAEWAGSLALALALARAFALACVLAAGLALAHALAPARLTRRVR
jgi:hypothetical protein